MSKRLRVLAIAEAANPQWVSVPLVGWSLVHALRDVADVHLVTQVRNRQAILASGLMEGKDFTAIDSEPVMRPLWKLTGILRGGEGKGWTTVTAISVIGYYYFEYLVWRRFGRAIRSGEYDVVHRITPLSPTHASILASVCYRAGVPFIVGPLNGGVPWPRGFGGARRSEREWLSYVRSLYRLLPFQRSTVSRSSALLVGSKDTLAQIPRRHRGKCVYVPENAINPDLFAAPPERPPDRVLRVCFVGRLVPYKGVDMLIEAAIPLLKEGRLQIDVIGDGPLMPVLKQTLDRENVDSGVALHGWVEHRSVPAIMQRASVLAFPSVREFGGAVVLEAMALGLVPLVVDYAGPGELVTQETGYKVPIGSREEIIAAFRERLELMVETPGDLLVMARAARTRALSLFTWQAKAAQVELVYRWVVGDVASKPQFF